MNAIRPAFTFKLLRCNLRKPKFSATPRPKPAHNGTQHCNVLNTSPRKQRHHTDKPVDPNAEFVGRLQAARMLGVDVQTVDAWIKSNRLKAYRPSRRVLIRRTDLLRMVEEAQV